MALVTGGGSGIGRATAELFAEQGAAVVVADLDSSGEQTVATIMEAGGVAMFVRTDVSVEADVVAAVQAAEAAYGPVDAAFNNAGVGAPRAPFEGQEAADWDTLMSVNLRGVWLCMKHELATMVPLGRGTIVNTASVAGVIGTAGLAAYTAAKHGVVGLTRTAAVEHGCNGIRVNALAPGLTNTALVKDLIEDPDVDLDELLSVTPLGRIAEPREMAEAALWLTSPASSYVTGHVLVADGGFTAQ
ncbi:MAG TPA: SDR family oxidoreductase [Mycobacteriales bacterium]|nr:SDR family oxidoreductase [Mycobacteriales bacterium]